MLMDNLMAQDSQLETYGDEQDIADIHTMQALAKAYFEKRHAMAPEQAKKEAYDLSDIQLGSRMGGQIRKWLE